MDKKIQTSSELLCKGFPVEFVKYLEYCKHLKFEDEPDYKFLRSLLKDRVLFKKCFFILDLVILNIMTRMNYEYDYIYEWTIVSSKMKNSIKLESKTVEISEQSPRK